jgi:hypothetical protein
MLNMIVRFLHTWIVPISIRSHRGHRGLPMPHSRPPLVERYLHHVHQPTVTANSLLGSAFVLGQPAPLCSQTRYVSGFFGDDQHSYFTAQCSRTSGGTPRPSLLNYSNSVVWCSHFIFYSFITILRRLQNSIGNLGR